MVGLRNAGEIIAARAERLIDLFIWVKRTEPEDTTQTFGPELCDFIIENNVLTLRIT